MDQTTQYRQLQPEDRMTMASMKQQGFSARAMARALGRSPSTITRELARNTLAAAIEKALVEGKVSPELRGEVRAMMTAEGARRAARGERFKVPVNDARAPRARAKPVQAAMQRHGDRERSR